MGLSTLSLATYDSGGAQRLIYDAAGLRWSTHYGENGGGYGYLRFSLPRPVGTDYADIGEGYRVILRKSINMILFDGQIRQIEEISSPAGDAISVTALGQSIVSEDDEILRTFCDKRLNMWRPESEIPKDHFRPDLYSAGSNTLGIYMHPNNGDEIDVDDYTELVYDFFPGEAARRFKATLSSLLGNGVVFDGEIASVDTALSRVHYTDDSGENYVQPGMVLHNLTRGQGVEITVAAPASNYFEVSSSTVVSGWTPGDELYVTGPLFVAQIDSIAGATVTYSEDVGEANIVDGEMLANLTKKSLATIQAHDTATNEIDVTDADDIDGWEETDYIVIGTSLFYAQINGAPAGMLISFDNDRGTRIVTLDVGWILVNLTRSPIEYATVDAWNVAGTQVQVTNAADIATWQNNDEIVIYTPIALSIRDSDDNVIWPTVDWREGAIPHSGTSINVTTPGAPTQFMMRLTNLVSGSYNESSFVQLTEVRAYSTTDDVTAEMLAKYIVELLSAAGHDWDTSEGDIESITKVVEPMVFEFVLPREAMRWVCSFGNDSDDPIAWGLRLDDRRRFYLETQDLDQIDYVVKRHMPVNVSMGGDLQESWQEVRGIYTDKLGEQQVTDWQGDVTAHFSGHYRRKSIRLDVDTEDEADTLVGLYLDENKLSKKVARYAVSEGTVFKRGNIEVPVDELQALGGLAMIEDWRSIEAGSSATDLRNRTIEQIVGVEIDYDAGTASLIPASAKSTFEAYIAELARIRAS